ncbi:MAG: hypothetical protein H0V47_17195 [Chloroflexia bacterium]|nr:hypothetical protein [Chloroflexia bacterium]
MTLVGGLTPEDAVERLLQTIDVPTAEPILVLPSMPNRPASGTHPKIAAGLLSAVRSPTAVGIPDGTTLPVKRRWENLARTLEARTVTLGRRGWDRVEFPGDSYRLDAAFLPSELTDAATLIAMPALRDDALAIGFWREVAHPHTRLRMHNVDRDWMMAELSTTLRANYLLDASRLSGGLSINLLAWTDNSVAAELVGLGIRRYLEEARGYESVGPWEHARVQAAAELGHGPMSGSAILLRADETLDGTRTIAVYLADQLGCGIEWVTARNTDGGYIA